MSAHRKRPSSDPLGQVSRNDLIWAIARLKGYGGLEPGERGRRARVLEWLEAETRLGDVDAARRRRRPPSEPS